MKTLVLAARNLLRNRHRSLAALLTIIIGSTSILLFGGYSKNLTFGLQTGFVQRSGHLQIQHKDYFLYGSGNPAAYGIVNYEQVIDAVKHDPVLASMLVVVTPTLQISGIAGNFSAGVSRTVIGSGVVPDDQMRMRQWNDYGLPLRTKALALTDTPEDAAIVGHGVARVLMLCGPLKVADCPSALAQEAPQGEKMPSDLAALSGGDKSGTANANATRIEILAANLHGAPNVTQLMVIKAEDQGVKELDDIHVTMHLARAQRLIYGESKPQATAVVLQLKHTNLMAAARARLDYLIKTTFKGQALEVQTYSNLNPFYGQSVTMFGAIFSFISVLIGVIVLFTVGNNMSMAVMERTVEIGTLRAIGLQRGGIRRLFIFEGILLGLAGTLTAVLLSLLLSYLINHSGLTWLPPGRVDRVPLTVRLWGETKSIFYCCFWLTLVTALSAWWPANRAANMNIVDALRHV